MAAHSHHAPDPDLDEYEVGGREADVVDLSPVLDLRGWFVCGGAHARDQVGHGGGGVALAWASARNS